MMVKPKDFSNIKQWLEPKLDQLGISKEEFSKRCGLSRALIYFYCADKNRPDVNTMAVMCQVLGVPLEEGLAQYTAKKVGRPAGSRSKSRVGNRAEALPPEPRVFCHPFD